METLESALALLLKQTVPIHETQEVDLPDALGRIAACDITSPMNVPPFDRSPLDGYALRAADVKGATPDQPVTLRVIGEADAGCGTVFHPMPGEALRIMTGAPVPAECDCVIRQEDTDEGMELAAFRISEKAGSNICRAGEDVRLGSVVVHAGDLLTSAHIGVLSSLGITHVCVYRRVRAALLCTGNEVMQPGIALTYGKIYDANGALLQARLTELGVTVRMLPPQQDDPEQVAALLLQALSDSDIVITTGGVSVGKKDIFHQVLPLMDANRLFWRVDMKPGSPMMAGEKDGKLIMCLSGNPFAALACFETFAVPVLRKLAGHTAFMNRRLRAPFSGSFGKAGKGRRIIRAFFDGAKVSLTAGQHSNGSLAAMIGCNCLIDVPAGTGVLNDGDTVEVILL